MLTIIFYLWIFGYFALILTVPVFTVINIYFLYRDWRKVN